MKCAQCGVDVLAESRFCQKCGARLDTAELFDDESNVPAESPQPTRAESTFDRLTGNREQGGGEGEVVWSGTYSAKAMIGLWIGIALVTLILLIIAFSLGGFWWTVFFIATPLLWIGGYAKLLYNQWSVRYTLTSKRFTHEHGLLRRVTDRVEVIDMDDVSVTQTLIDRFTGTGNIQIISSDRSHPELQLKGIDGALAIGAQMDDARRAERERRGLHIESI